MYRITLSLGSLLLLACGTPPGTESPVDQPADGGGGTTTTATSGGGGTGNTGPGTDPLDFPSDDDFDEDATVDDALDATITAPTQLTDDGGAVVAMTGDDRVVYSTADGVFSIKAAIGASPRKAASNKGETTVLGRTIFNFADVDYASAQGYLTFWTPAVGRRTIGVSAVGADRISARHDDAYMLFARNLQSDTMDIVVCSADKEHAQVLVEGAGKGDLDTCGARYGFAGDAAVVAWCDAGSIDATVARFTVNGQGQWAREDVSTSAQTQWASDSSGQRLLYVTSAGDGIVSGPTGDSWLSAGVNWGLFDNTGSVVFFTVGDQLRRQGASGSPVPVVVQGFDQAVVWNADKSRVVYSNQVVYEDSEKRDLSVTSTDWFNATPTSLVNQPIAELGRSVLTTTGDHVLYFTDVVQGEGGKLFVRPITGGAAVTFPDVDTVLAAEGNTILFTDNRTDPGTYPALVDLKKVEAGGVLGPELIESGIVEGRDIQVRSDRNTVAYRRDGAVVSSIWLRPISNQP